MRLLGEFRAGAERDLPLCDYLVLSANKRDLIRCDSSFTRDLEVRAGFNCFV